MRKVTFLLVLLCAACGNSTHNAAPTSTSTASVGETKPTVTIPNGAPPGKLVIQDIRAGTGAEAKAGATVTVQYVGASWSTHKEFDSSWDRGQPATFALSQVIQGWQQGIPGMKEGGRRRLTIPPGLGYGQQGSTGIAPGETLVFVIDLIKVA